MKRSCRDCACEMIGGKEDLCSACAEKRLEDRVICRRCGQVAWRPIRGLCVDCLKLDLEKSSVIKSIVNHLEVENIDHLCAITKYPKGEIAKIVDAEGIGKVRGHRCYTCGANIWESGFCEKCEKEGVVMEREEPKVLVIRDDRAVVDTGVGEPIIIKRWHQDYYEAFTQTGISIKAPTEIMLLAKKELEKYFSKGAIDGYITFFKVKLYPLHQKFELIQKDIDGTIHAEYKGITVEFLKSGTYYVNPISIATQTEETIKEIISIDNSLIIDYLLKEESMQDKLKRIAMCTGDTQDGLKEKIVNCTGVFLYDSSSSGADTPYWVIFTNIHNYTITPIMMGDKKDVISDLQDLISEVKGVSRDLVEKETNIFMALSEIALRPKEYLDGKAKSKELFQRLGVTAEEVKEKAEYFGRVMTADKELKKSKLF